MSTEDSSCTWLSMHVYHQPLLQASDRVLLDVLRPFLSKCFGEGWATRFFFVRYSDAGGPHIRLRIYGYRHQVHHIVRPSLEAHVAGWRHALALHNGGDAETESAYLPLARGAVYEPEVYRYGGPAGLVASERIFFCSSKTALRLLPDCATDYELRLGCALGAMVVLLGAVADTWEQALSLAARCDATFRQQLLPMSSRPAMLEQFEAAYAQNGAFLRTRIVTLFSAARKSIDTLPEAMVEYAQELKVAVAELRGLVRNTDICVGSQPSGDWADVIHYLVGSYVHLSNNRFGIAPYEESYLAYVTARAFRETLLDAG